ncbi:MAG: hypothetical protein LH647_00035, partial [Leptolyngbyaceae cyanobacterium CAN_BIN12]|nr:hypothetical protein [Leptolyngbyaceae cyanobacterium CAN_BIN12]
EGLGMRGIHTCIQQCPKFFVTIHCRKSSFSAMYGLGWDAAVRVLGVLQKVAQPSFSAKFQNVLPSAPQIQKSRRAIA